MANISLYLIIIAVCTVAVNSYNAYNDMKILKAFWNNPTPPKDHAKVARELVHKANWAATGTISTDNDIKGFPMVNIISIADSAKDARSTGDIYFLLTLLDFTAQDVEKKNALTFMISDDEDLTCSHMSVDPMEPTCPRVMLSGKVIQIDENSAEYKFANESFVSRHPASVNWKRTHKFFLCKLDIQNIFVLDWYGGPHRITSQEYYKADINQDDLLPNYYNIDLENETNDI